MITEMRTLTAPTWGDLHTQTSIAKLMHRLLDPEICDVEVIHFESMSFITLVSQTYSASFLKIREDDWATVYHMLRTDPSNCTCWACDWRKKRSRFCNTKDYEHLKLL